MPSPTLALLLSESYLSLQAQLKSLACGVSSHRTLRHCPSNLTCALSCYLPGDFAGPLKHLHHTPVYFSKAQHHVILLTCG